MHSTSEQIDELTRTFLIDRAYCDALFKSPSAALAAELLVSHLWANSSLPICYKALSDSVPSHFGTRSERAALWNLALLDGINRDLRILPYLLLRGLAAESSGSLRRALEHLGVLTHIWQTQEKVDALENPESYKKAFRFEADGRKRDALKAANNSKRFEALRSGVAATKLYENLSEFDIHGGTALRFFTTSAQPSQLSCSFVQRPDAGGEQFGRRLSILSNVHRTICGELICLCVDKGTRTDDVVAAATSFQMFARPVGEPTVELAQTAMELLEKIGISGSKEIH